jgi:hypothetical protein
LLRETWSQAVPEDDVVRRLHDALKEINEKLWEIEDDIRHSASPFFPVLHRVRELHFCIFEPEMAPR